AITLKAYPAELSLTAWICLLGTAEGTVLALVMERGNAAVWSIGWGTQLLAAVYSDTWSWDGNSSNEDLKLPIKQTTEMQESSSSVQELNSVDSNNEQKS
ncbi:WAT1-related protein, partial [Cucurbita argyrosperma subsp. argyrosperma]